MRARRKPWTEKELTTNPLFIHNPTEYKGRWKEYFGNDNPIHLEVGCGKGRFITTLAAQNPNINYLALEREKQVIVMAARTAREIKCSLGFINADVTNLSDIFDENEIQRLYINFCDPWPNRKKWAKRRLTYRGFLEKYAFILEKCGEIRFKTDNLELFEFSLEEFKEKNWGLKDVSYDLHNSGVVGNIMTEYEERFSGMGMPIYACTAYIDTNED